MKTPSGVPAMVVWLLWAGAAFGQDQQMGARAKALGGAGTAFEDDPHSLWFNPAGTATQPGGVAISYQTYPFYEEQGNPLDTARARPNVNDPVFIPSFLGVVLPVGSPELPQTIGLCAATPFHLYFPFNGPNPTTPPTDGVIVDQTFMRLRLTYAVDFRLRPIGDAGFFSHAAVGAGLDLSINQFEYTSPPDNEDSPIEYDMTVSGGVGVLLGFYENGEDLRVTVGLSYQGPAAHRYGNNLKAPSGVVPAFDFPQQFQFGLAFHLMERMPLRVSLEVLWTDWKGAARESNLPGIEGFEEALSVSAGVEYRIDAAPAVGILPRAGLRYYDAPWRHSERSRLPGWGDHQLFIDSRNEQFFIFSFGFGLSWGNKEGTQDTLDVAFEIGGDAPSLAVSYTFQF